MALSWKDHVAKSMRGKKFASRAEANDFMKKLSAEWKKKKVGGTIDEFNVANKEVNGGGCGRGRRRSVMGGSTSLLLSKGLGDGTHLSVLPK